MTDSLRSILRSLRSLLVEIYPPDLRVDGLEAALHDLVAPAVGAGVSATVRVDGVHDASEETVRLVWRVAQEAVRNSLRHADPATLMVDVQGSNGAVVLTVHDDGRGFDDAQRQSGGLGLRGLGDLIHGAGGHLRVDSAPGQGTTLRLEVPR